MKQALRYIAILCIMLAAPAMLRCAEASPSRLASGKWAKINVEKSGMQFVSNATLASMGFKDPAKVNAYGFGGALISENLSDPHPDDLPLLPTIHTAKGILFFGLDNVAWTPTGASDDKSIRFSHQLNPYGSESWYFLSDAEADLSRLLPQAESPAGSFPSTDRYTECLLHERDLVAPANTGRHILGEDFRSPSTQTFPFTLTDAADALVRARVGFGSYISSGSGSLMFSANGSRIPSTSSDAIGAVTGAEQFMRYVTLDKAFSIGSENLQFAVEFKYSGSLNFARLDYIQIEYSRRLRLHDGQLYFNSDASAPVALRLDGADASTTVWDVTLPYEPKLVKSSLAGSTLTFNAPAGMRRYVAFSSSAAGYPLSKFEAVACQDLHSLPAPDLLIIAPTEYMAAANRVADMHRRVDSMTVHVVTPQQLYNEFSSGNPDISAFRKALLMWRRMAMTEGGGGPRYCLLFGRPAYDFKTSAKPSWTTTPTWLSPSGFSQTSSYSTDDFIGMLDDSPGNFNIASAKIHVAVGRFPVISTQEADLMADKLIKYVEHPELGAWRNNVMLIADDQDSGIHLSQAEKVYSALNTSESGAAFLYDRLYLDAYEMVATATGNTYPVAKERMLRNWNDGVMYINYIGHASPKEWGHEDFLNWRDINAFTNKRLPFLYAATCEFARWDADDRCGAEVLWLYPESGIIATICPNRTVYITQNGTLNELTHRNTLTLDDKGLGQRIGDIMINGKNAYSITDDNKLRYILMGDPAMRLPTPPMKVAVNSILGVDLQSEEAERPVIKARAKAKVAGHIARPDGSTDTDFNGIVDIRLHDAEMPVETNGNGPGGVVSVYNDRNTLLYMGTAKVTAGLWQTEILMPSEIENNYSPARLTLYAKSDKGAEAHGQCTSFYVYGYDETAPADDKGPEIEYFALNRPDFRDGDLVHSTPVALAAFSDESGINLSDAGIGHKLSLRLDGKTYFEDLNSYYSPDPEDATAGSIAYPLPELQAGDHTLELTVWDNANNATTSSLTFTVGVAKEPVIYDISTDVNPAVEAVNFLLSTDRPMASVECLVEVFDLNGRTVWRSDRNTTTDVTAALSIPWNLCDSSGQRVARGIYLYRATVTTPEGRSVTASKKLAVAAN